MRVILTVFIAFFIIGCASRYPSYNKEVVTLYLGQKASFSVDECKFIGDLNTPYKKIGIKSDFKNNTKRLQFFRQELQDKTQAMGGDLLFYQVPNQESFWQGLATYAYTDDVNAKVYYCGFEGWVR